MPKVVVQFLPAVGGRDRFDIGTVDAAVIAKEHCAVAGPVVVRMMDHHMVIGMGGLLRRTTD